MKWNLQIGGCLLAMVACVGCGRPNEPQNEAKAVTRPQRRNIDDIVHDGMSEGEVIAALDVSQVSPELGGSLWNSAYYCRSNKFPGRIVQLQFSLGKDAWRLREWKMLNGDEARIVEKAESRGRGRFREIAPNWTKGREEVLARIREVE